MIAIPDVRPTVSISSLRQDNRWFCTTLTCHVAVTISLRKEKHDVHRTIKLRQTTGWAAPESETMEQIDPTSGEMDGNGWKWMKTEVFCGSHGCRPEHDQAARKVDAETVLSRLLLSQQITAPFP